MTKKSGNYKIPFCKIQKDWHMMEWTDSPEGVIKTGVGYEGYKPDIWRDNLEFDADVQLTGQYKGRSAARVTCTWQNESYSMGLSAFYEAVLAFGVKKGGTIKGRWSFRKQGANYGLYPVL